MGLGIFTRAQADGLDFAQQHLAQDLPLEFSEAFDAAWREGILFGQSVSSSTARMQGVQEHLDGIREKTGVLLPNPALSPIGGEAAALDDYNAQLAALAPRFPDLDLKPLTTADLDRLGEEKARRARQDYKKAAAREQTWGGMAGLLLGTVAAGAADPVNIVTLPLAAPRALGIVGTALATAGITAGTQVGIEAVAAPFKEKVEPGYSASGEAVQNVLNAGIAGGVLGGGAKGLSALWTRYKTGSWPRHIRDAGNVVASEGQIEETALVPTIEGEIGHRSALQQSIDALVSGRPVDVSETVTPELLRAYGARLDPVLEARANARAAEESAFALERESARLPGSMERLSELQLGEIRGTAQAMDREAADAFAALRAEADSLSARRSALDGRAPERDARRAEVEGLRTDLADAEQRLAEARAQNDPATQARLAAIDADLAADGLPAARRTELEAERTTITETLAATAPADARAIASLEAEAKGLRKALARQEKALARAEATDARAGAALDRADADLPRRITANEQRAAGRREAVTTELRRAVARLAQEGYGVRLSRDEAEQLAARILNAGDGESDVVLRSITEDLVDRALHQRRSEPSLPPGPGRPDPVGEQRARAGHWTEQMRKRIQGLAREVGYDMPRDEAAGIAAAVARAPTDDEALALLDEVMLRPRTVVETLPGTLAARRLEAADYRRSASARAVRDDVFRQLVAAGVPEEEATAQSAIWGARYHARARRLGLEPGQAFDLYQREGVDIRAAEAPDALGPDSLAQMPPPGEAFPAGDGFEARTSMRKRPGSDEEVLAFSLHREGEAKSLGQVELYQRPDGRWETDFAYVPKDARGQGLATRLYDAVEQATGTKLAPAGELLEPGYQFWAKRDPDAVQWYRKVGKAWYSPRRLMEELAGVGMQEAAEGRSGLSLRGDALQAALDGLPPEAKAPRAIERMFQSAPAVPIEELRAQLASEFPSVDFFLSEQMGGRLLVLSKIVVPDAERGQGIGAGFMSNLIAAADRNGQTIALTPSSDFGGSKARLEKWYRSLGFVKNQGRARDFSISEAMYREPQSSGQMFQSQQDRGGRSVPASMNAEVELQPLVLADLPPVENWKDAEKLVPLGRTENLTGTAVDISTSSTGKWFSGRANETKRALAPHLVDLFQRSVTYHEGKDGWAYAVGRLNLDGQDVAVRFVINRMTGKPEGKLYQIEGIEVASLGWSSDVSAAVDLSLGSEAAPRLKVAQAVDAFNSMKPGEAPLFQPEGAAPRGAITMAENRALIELFQGRDASTFMHESSHLWLTEMVRDAEAAPGVKADLDTVLRWLGVDDAAKIGVEHQEKWARGFEAYLRDGKAPSTGLARAFEQFKDWLTSIYRAVTDLGGEIPDDIRGVMDRMLSAPESEGVIGARNQREAYRTGSRGSRIPEPIGRQEDMSPVGAAQGPDMGERPQDFDRSASPSPAQLAALAPELTPEKIRAARSSQETEAAVLHDLDKLRATRDLQIPVGERFDEAGQRVADMRSVDDLMDEADARLAAAAEIRACAMPMPEVSL